MQMQDHSTQVLGFHVSRQGGERIRELVSAAPLARLAGLSASAQDFERSAVRAQPDVLLVEYMPEKNGVYDLLGRLRRSVPKAALVAVSQSKDPDAILNAMRLGVQEYLTEPVPATAFNDAVIRLKRATKASGLALNLSWGLSQNLGQLVALCDLDLAGGDQANLMDLSPSRDIGDVARNFTRLDEVLMGSLLTEVAPSLRLLAAPPDPVAAEEITSEHVGRALDHLADNHTVVVLDLPSRLDDVGLMAMDRAHHVLLVAEPTILGLKAARRIMILSDRLGYGREKISVIVNRMGMKGGLSKREVADTLGAAVSAYLPEEPKVMTESANAGIPMMADRPRSRWSKGVSDLASRVASAAEEGK